jgi:hypothetical protein
MDEMEDVKISMIDFSDFQSKERISPPSYYDLVQIVKFGLEKNIFTEDELIVIVAANPKVFDWLPENQKTDRVRNARLFHEL